MTKCRICGAEIKPFVSYGQMPIANNFLKEEDFGSEYFFELAAAYCPVCHMTQLIEQPEPERMFHENYAFFSSTSKFMQKHFEDFANQVIDTHTSKKEDAFVVELGSNDGIMLKHFASKNIRHLGVEPSENVAEVARKNGVNTTCEFFGKKYAEKIVAEYGHADAVMSANVMCHIPDLNSVAAGISLLLKPDGKLIFEDPYLGAVVEKTSYDQLYDEHVFLFSAISVAEAFGRHGLELIDLQPLWTHGGSMRYTLAPKGAYEPSAAVKEITDKEIAQGLKKPETYDQFARNCEKNKKDLFDILEKLKNEGKRVVGYAATSKSTTILNYCGIGPQHIEYILDTTPLKQGKFTPGTHIPVVAPDAFYKDYPDYAVQFAWNHQKEIMEKETEYSAQGGKWIFFVPNVHVA